MMMAAVQWSTAVNEYKGAGGFGIRSFSQKYRFIWKANRLSARLVGNSID